MSESFSVGDRIEVIRANLTRHCNVRVGDRGTVDEAVVPDMPGFVGVVMDDGQDLYSRISCIRKLPPPQREPTSTWDDVIVWRPKEIAHV